MATARSEELRTLAQRVAEELAADDPPRALLLPTEVRLADSAQVLR
ncbi:MAG TPA: hypothetical protein VE985_09975 [Gaiellaceae bacterium]|nr:hypothetical protein [Gaiellaceae bacterium]